MESTRIQNGQTERIEVLALDSSSDPATGLTDVLLFIRRTSDGYFLDFDDNTFKASGWTDIDKVMTEIDAANDAGKYKYDFDTSGFSDDTYELRSTCASASNFPQTGELKVGDYVDNIVTMRGTDNAALASVCTETRLAELAAANIPADVDALLARLTAVRAGYLDNLSAGAVALAAALVTAQADLDKIENLLSGKMEWDSANSRFKIYDQSDILAYYLYVKDKDGDNVVMTGTGPVQRNVKVEAV